MPITKSCLTCGKTHLVRDEDADKPFECSQCGDHLFAVWETDHRPEAHDTEYVENPWEEDEVECESGEEDELESESGLSDMEKNEKEWIIAILIGIPLGLFLIFTLPYIISLIVS